MFSKSTVKYIQSLQHKKFRDEEGVFVAEGPKLVNELLEGKTFVCRQIYALQEWVGSESGHTSAVSSSNLTIIKDFELEKISSLATPNLVLAVFEQKKASVEPALENKITLVLDDIQDPGNLGTIIRIADWFGVENIFCSLKTVDMYNFKVVQSTMASLQRVNLVYTDIVAWAGQQTIKKYAASLNGEPLGSFKKLQEGILMIGNESKGLSETMLELADQRITIPRTGRAESLNAAVATGIILYGFRS